jgi:predicted transcriptional regulator
MAPAVQRAFVEVYHDPFTAMLFKLSLVVDVAPYWSESMAEVDVAALTSEIVSSFVSNNAVKLEDLGGLIRTVHSSITSLDGPAQTSTPVSPVKLTPGRIRKSITADALISFEDGKPYKTLKRHLARFDLTFADYKTKWGLPGDYPSVAPSYSAQRSQMALRRGLGKTSAKKGKVLGSKASSNR